LFHGFLNLDKPRGVTSRDVVNGVVRIVGREVKVGHAGTLDPLASGVLVVALGAGTRLIELIQDQPKVYRTVIRLGTRSDTMDANGTITETPDPVVPSEESVRRAVAAQVGTIDQVPPQFSALKVSGRRAYDLARAGQTVELAARPVRIERIDVLAYAWPRLELEITCGGGTYIRSIARDVGEALGCGGLVEVLVRERIGPFLREQAIDPRSLTAEGIAAAIHPLSAAVGDWTSRILDEDQRGRILRGQPLDAKRLPGGAPPPGDVALLGQDGQLLALGEHDTQTGRIHPRKVFQY
jgi:tRNA pseudouridine55 synthase